MTRLMGGASSTCQEPDGVSTETVEPRATATRSYSLSIDTLLEVAHIQRPVDCSRPQVGHCSAVVCPGTLLTNLGRQSIFVSAFG